MGDKEPNMMLGEPAYFFCDIDTMEPLKIVEDSLELEESYKREKMLGEHLKIEPVSFECEIPNDAMPEFLGLDLASEPSKETYSLIVQTEPKINKPKNLKYPNKKRARRIWKKWKRRFGTTPGKEIYLPNCRLETNMVMRNGEFQYNINAKAEEL